MNFIEPTSNMHSRQPFMRATEDRAMANGKNALVNSFPPYFGVRRELQFPPLERIDFAALDGTVPFSITLPEGRAAPYSCHLERR